MAGHVGDVNKYAPEGFELLVSHYADGRVSHVFVGTVGKDKPAQRLVCVVGPNEDEEAALSAFQARYIRYHEKFAPTIPAPAEIPASPTVKAKRGGK